MKKLLFFAAASLPLFALSGCGTAPISHGAPAIYCVAAVCALILLAGSFAITRGKDIRLMAVFACIALVNCSYLALALSRTVSEALWANRTAYLGSVFLLPAMLSIIMAVTETPKKKWLFPALLAASAVIFLVTATPGWLGIYYRSVTLDTVNGATVLRKVYGPLHRVYTVYLLGYFAAMIALILRAARKKHPDAGGQAVFLGMAVFVNIGVWLLEQVVHSEFELLAISYIISELFLLGLHLLVTEQKKKLELAVAEAVQTAPRCRTGASRHDGALSRRPAAAHSHGTGRLRPLSGGKVHQGGHGTAEHQGKHPEVPQQKSVCQAGGGLPQAAASNCPDRACHRRSLRITPKRKTG